jgi:hypothetical protein
MRSGWQTGTSLVLDTYLSYNETPPGGRGPALWTQVVLPPEIRHRVVPAREKSTHDVLEQSSPPATERKRELTKPENQG